MSATRRPTMPDLTAAEWLTIAGRGKVAVIGALPGECGLTDPRELKGRRVRIDGRQYDVTGVETHAVPFGQHRGPFGLLVLGPARSTKRSQTR